MKRGPLNFLGRKNQSLFDTNIKIKDMDKVELVLGSTAIPESGTASVRARPTVNHHTSSSDSFQGFAVPTPKVPLLPPVKGPKINGLDSGDRLSNGSVISVPDLLEGEIFVPPPPSMAPPPPPGMFVPPPPDFMGDLNSLNLATLSPSMSAPKPTSMPHFKEEEDLTLIKPPPMAPPKPPSTNTIGSVSSVPSSIPPSAKVFERPTFSPPQLPEWQHKTNKKPPTKPIRLSSIMNFDSPPQSPAPPPPVQTSTLSTFNPQNTAKLYNVPNTSTLHGYEEHDPRSKKILLLEDSASGNTAPVLVQVDGKTPNLTPPSKPVLKDVQELKENLQIIQPPQSPLPEPNKEAKTVSAQPAHPEIDKSLQTPHLPSPQLQKPNSSRVNSEPIKDKLEGSPSQGRKFSPIIDRKLRNLRSSETHGTRDGPAASPLALLMAAKERDKHRLSHPLSRENSAKTKEQPSASIHQSVSSPNSFIVTPKSSSPSSLTSVERVQESLKDVSPVVHKQTIHTPEKSSSPALVNNQMPSTSSVLSRMAASTPNLADQRQNSVQSISKSPPIQHEDLSMPFLPPPPEFDDFDEIMEPPPSISPPDPPMKKAPTPTEIPPTPSHVPPPPPKPKPAAPKLPPPDIDVKPKLQVQTKAKAAPAQLPSNLSPSQATLLSILQKKMLEMDNKMAPVNEAESSSEDWGTPLSEEHIKVPVVPRATPQSKSYPVVNKAATLDMQELENKLVRKNKEGKVPTSNGTQSKHPFGMTFTVRPGTKQPITPVSKEVP
ncbi:uncharacterized protein C6orf132 homolog [Etheostoma cragini]|uniref:uncharacterized protein C6orf132 homolog n=1 Tax=Etheostoma cragini TaxID=417921 RepID=UPI00155E6DF9|nr:uncharacterized protein C6orf132 homolog [Etheostoma cragini]